MRGDAIPSLPGMLGGWTQSRDLRPFPKEGFRDWWKGRSQGTGPADVNAAPPETVQKAEDGPIPPQKKEGGQFDAEPPRGHVMTAEPFPPRRKPNWNC